MRVPIGTMVLAVDGSKMLLLENRGEAFSPRLEVIEQQEQDVPPDRDLSTDRPGRSHSSVGPGRSAMEETDFHEQAEDRFIAEGGARLNELSRSTSDNGGTRVLASPGTPGKLRTHNKNSQGGKRSRKDAE